MPRPVKCRKVCHFPQILEFLPADDTEKKMPIVLTVDEYETIRLLDKKGYSQEPVSYTHLDVYKRQTPYRLSIIENLYGVLWYICNNLKNFIIFPQTDSLQLKR